jgi:hypothetical protein
MKNKTIIGRLAEVSFPEFGLENYTAKIDTGAYTSSLHCDNIHLENDKLCFWLVDDHNHQISRSFETKDFFKKRIRSSNGKTQLRYIIKTKIRIKNKTYKTEFSLSDRSKMKYPVLLGRKLLTNKFIVDVSVKY